MKVFHSPAEVPTGFGPSVVTIGNFDGVHIGHREIMRRVVAIAGEQRWVPTVLTFDPHPARVLAPERAPRLINTIDQKLRRLASEGIEAVLLLPFSLDFAKLSPEEFAQQILVQTLNTRCILVGEDFRFGHRQSGNIETLRALGARLGFELRPVAEIAGRGLRVSSSSIRQLVASGKVCRACRLMSAPFALTGEVVKGHGVGSKVTVPTLNLAYENELLPRNGVYVTRTRDPLASREWNSITNVGNRPTFSGDALTVETFLLDPFDGETPARIEVSFLAFIRAERKFADPSALRSQIIRDAGAATRFHRRLARLRVA